MNPIKNLKIGDIMISDLVYYDENIKDDCSDFCKKLGISSMPDFDRKSYISKEDGKFKKQKLVSDQHFKTDDLLFDKKTIEKFKNDKDNVLFVLNADSEIIGVVHISDYNNETLHLHFYKYIMLFEKNLRRFLKGQGYKNADLVSHIQKNMPRAFEKYFPESDKKRRDKNQKRMQSLADFEMFELSELMNFANSTKKVTIKDEVKDLRNWVAHFSSAVGFELEQEMQVFYDIRSLDSFIDRIEAFCSAYEKIESKLLQQTNKEKIEKMISQYG